jgi:hypothetical protein
MISFDQLKLTRRDPRELKRWRSHLLGLQRSELHEAAIVHENDGSCCRLEPWPATLQTLTSAVMGEKKTLIV